MTCKIKPRTSLDSLRAVKDGNVRKRTLRPNRVRVQFHDVVITKDKAEDGPRLYLWCDFTPKSEPISEKMMNYPVSKRSGKNLSGRWLGNNKGLAPSRNMGFIQYSFG